METIYRDYGVIGENAPGPNNRVQITPRRQVYQATHRGDKRLPLMDRSFMSFSYGGRHIEDFDLILTIVNDRMQKNGYANFNDIVTSYTSLDGQYYWNTHYTTNSLTCVLATDGIEQKMLDEFLFWFRAGEAKELILAEHPGRAIMARVAQPPELSLLPFEYDTTTTVSSYTYTTKTTLYKGEITVEFVMDEPHWYSIYNILGREDTVRNRYVDEWYDENTQGYISIFASQDALKILLEDGIPLGSMIDNNMLLGNGAFANVESNPNTVIWDPKEPLHYDPDTYEPIGTGARIAGFISDQEYANSSRIVMATDGTTAQHPQWLSTESYSELFYDLHELDIAIQLQEQSTYTINDLQQYMKYTNSEYASVEEFAAANGLELGPGGDVYIISDEKLWTEELQRHLPSHTEYHPMAYTGMIAGPIVDLNGNGLNALVNVGSQNTRTPKYGYFFYAGTAPAPTIIEFDMNVEFAPDTGYFNTIGNRFATPETPYSTFTIESKERQSLKLTTPNLFTSYNKALSILSSEIMAGTNIVDIRNRIISEVKHPAVRTWVMSLLSDDTTDFSTIPDLEYQIKRMMQNMFASTDRIHFRFNSKTGEAIGRFQYRVPNEPLSFLTVVYEEGMEERVKNILYGVNVEDETASQAAYQNLQAWQWADYCIDNEGILLKPDQDTSDSLHKYGKAVQAFKNYINEHERDLISIPGIFKAMDINTLTSLQTATENVGDMLLSNYIIIRDRNYPTEAGKIKRWEESINGRTYSHRIYHTFNDSIYNVQIYYRNMYL